MPRCCGRFHLLRSAPWLRRFSKSCWLGRLPRRPTHHRLLRSLRGHLHRVQHHQQRGPSSWNHHLLCLQPLLCLASERSDRRSQSSLLCLCLWLQPLLWQQVLRVLEKNVEEFCVEKRACSEMHVTGKTITSDSVPPWSPKAHARQRSSGPQTMWFLSRRRTKATGLLSGYAPDAPGAVFPTRRH